MIAPKTGILELNRKPLIYSSPKMDSKVESEQYLLKRMELGIAKRKCWLGKRIKQEGK